MATEIVLRNAHCDWIDVEAATPEDLAFIHEKFDINRLLLEDTTDPNHLPKFEEYEGTKFFLMRENIEDGRNSLNTISDISTKLGVFIQNNVIITIHRMQNRSVKELKAEVALGKCTTLTPEKIALKLALKVMESFDDESEFLMDKLDKFENEVFLKSGDAPTDKIRKLYRIKRKSGLNTRVLNMSSEWVEKFKTLGLPDAEVVDLKDKHKDVSADFDHLNAQVTNLISMYIALSDQRANQVMKLLAIYSMYFLPISFIAGLYGMNFENIPELHTKYGYFITLGVMGAIIISTFIYTKRKHWL